MFGGFLGLHPLTLSEWKVLSVLLCVVAIIPCKGCGLTPRGVFLGCARGLSPYAVHWLGAAIFSWGGVEFDCYVQYECTCFVYFYISDNIHRNNNKTHHYFSIRINKCSLVVPLWYQEFTIHWMTTNHISQTTSPCDIRGSVISVSMDR